MPATESFDFAQPIALFPLANVVLLPHGTTPLHIFEPRYRAMIRNALDAKGTFALATFQGQQWRRDYLGHPPLRPCVTLAHILRYHPLPDGRYNLLCQGLGRARIVEELPPTDDGYRRAYLEKVGHGTTMEIDLEIVRRHIEKQLRDPDMQSLAHVEKTHNLLNQEIPTCALVDLAAMLLCHNVEDRYAVLSEGDAAARAAWFDSYLSEIGQCLRMAKKQGVAVSPNGLYLN